jgi:hypothetical protein
MLGASHRKLTTEGSTVENRRTVYDVGAVAAFAGKHVRVRLDDGSTHSGRLRTELLSDRSLSVYIAGTGDEGATLYIDQIVEIMPLFVPPGT